MQCADHIGYNGYKQNVMKQLKAYKCHQIVNHVEVNNLGLRKLTIN